ncbi:MAG: hydroxyacid dehydrogenase [Oscillospiraceae bacterium]|nr:hydroxyacid dehydrogenase [Oscillospiraceae bacterium]
MNLLVTGAFNCSSEQIKQLEDMGYNVIFQQDERGELAVDAKCIDAVICNGLFLYHNIDEFLSLKLIQLTSAGLDRVPLEKISERGIKLFNARGVYSVPMAEFAVCGVLELYKHSDLFFENQKRRIWEKDRTVRELQGDTVCIVGCGSVGTECAKRFKAFGTTVIGADLIEPKSECYDGYVPMDRLSQALIEADVVILTLPLTDETRGMFNKDMFACFKDGAVLVNIARGAVVNEKDMISALESGILGGAVLDVFQNEPLPENSSLWSMENVIVTPHNSFVSLKNNGRLFDLIIDDLKAYMDRGKNV